MEFAVSKYHPDAGAINERVRRQSELQSEEDLLRKTAERQGVPGPVAKPPRGYGQERLPSARGSGRLSERSTGTKRQARPFPKNGGENSRTSPRR